jgi:hypothetical protein
MDAIKNRPLKGDVEGAPGRRLRYASVDGQLFHEWCLGKSFNIFGIVVLPVFSRVPLRKGVVNA